MTAGLRWNPAQELVDGLPRPDSELARLAGGLHDGSLTRPDRDRLETLLEHPDARRAFRKLSNLHANLLCLWHETAQAQGDSGSQEQGGSSAAAGSGRGRTRRNADLSNRFAAAVAVVARGALGWLRKLGRPVPLACLVAGAVLTVTMARALPVAPSSVPVAGPTVPAAARKAAALSVTRGTPEHPNPMNKNKAPRQNRKIHFMEPT